MTHLIELFGKVSGKDIFLHLEKSVILYGWNRGLDTGPFDDGEKDARVVGLEDDDGSCGEGGHPPRYIASPVSPQQPLALVDRGTILSDPGPRNRPEKGDPTPGWLTVGRTKYGEV